MRELTKEQSSKANTIELYKTIKEVGNILSQNFSIEIIFHLSHEPLRYKQLKKLLKCSDNTLSRRLEKLQEYNTIERLPVILGNKKSHEYTITDSGQELIKFFHNYSRKREIGGR